ncbi:MAG: carboxypeptidase regulatory-like domain-containing protein [Gemmatimonadales bacterium]
MFGLATAILLLAQTPQASIAGVVRDAESGARLADAMVALPDLNRSVTTDSLGRYRFHDLPAGPQHLTVRRIGYALRTLHAFVPDQGLLEIAISLQPAPMHLPGLVVRSPAALRGLEEGDSTPFPDRGVSIAAVRNDPLLAEPDGLLALDGGEVTSNPESPSGLHLRGAASDQTGYLLDGIPVFSPYHTAGIFSAWNPDALERLQVSSSTPSPAYPEALSGTVTAITRAPAPTFTTQGTMSTSQARVMVDGPLGNQGAGFLLSLRAGYPGWAAPRQDPSYLRGETQDLLAKLETPLLRGSLRLLFFELGNSVASSSQTETAGPRNGFEWGSRSIGAQWGRDLGSAVVRLQGWSASSEAEATWLGVAPLDMVGERQDEGLLALLETDGLRASTTAGFRLERSHTAYRSGTGNTTPLLELNARVPLASVSLQHRRELGRRLTGSAGMAGIWAAGGLHLNLQGGLRWRVWQPVVLSASYMRSHQFAQSLRNGESVVGNIFPAELFTGSGANGVPVARNDRGVLAADYRPTANLRLGLQGYVSNYRGLLLVAPSTTEPFATRGFLTGSGTVPGISVNAALSGARYGMLASYGWQRVRLEYADSSYTPAYGTSQVLEFGAIVFPSATSSIRVGFTGSFGRRSTGVTGAFEWEACNLLDQGCEFGGSPQTEDALGAANLPAYARLDLGVRRHWHLRLVGRDVMLAAYGTLTNLLGRSNVLTMATDPATGRRTPIEMRPRAPLVVGLDWRF